MFESRPFGNLSLPANVWILATGSWNDGGVWSDGASWIG